jgi:hypothetical protein
MSKKYNALFSLLVFVIIALYHIIIYKPYLLHVQFQPAFYFDVHFLNGFLHYPGGPSELLSLFIFQFFAYKFFAVLLLSGILFCVYGFAQLLLKNVFVGAAPIVVSTVPAILLMMIYNAYNVPLVVAIKFVVVLFLAWLYSFDKKISRFLLLIILPLVYFFLGGWFTGLFSTLVLAIHLASPQPFKTLYLPLLFVILFGLSAYVSARYLYYISLREAFVYILPFRYFHEPTFFRANFLFYMLSFSLPLLLLLWRFVDALLKISKKYRPGFIAILVNSAVTVLLFSAAMFFTQQQDEKRKIVINDLAEHSQWKEVLRESKKMRQYDRIVEFQTNRAMYFTGCLLDSLFFIEHPAGVNGLFVDRIIASQIAMYASDLYFDLGHINAAQVMAYEYQTKYRYDPRVLKRLALTNAINGHYSKAEKFIKLLSKSLMHKSWVNEHVALLDKSSAARMQLVALKRLHQPKVDFFLHSQSPNIDLAGLLQASSTNKMAFEYLMAYYLLECRLGNIASRLGMLKHFDYSTTPLHIEEAAIMYQTAAKSSGGSPLTDFRFRREQIQRFAHFNKIMANAESNQQRKVQLAGNGYAHSFWYYFIDDGGTRTNSISKKRVDAGF